MTRLYVEITDGFWVEVAAGFDNLTEKRNGFIIEGTYLPADPAQCFLLSVRKTRFRLCKDDEELLFSCKVKSRLKNGRITIKTKWRVENAC